MRMYPENLILHTGIGLYPQDRILGMAGRADDDHGVMSAGCAPGGYTAARRAGGAFGGGFDSP